MTDNRTNEPTPEQIEAAAQAVREVDARAGLIADVDLPMYRARAALEAAAGAAPQAPKDIHEPNHDRVYCVRCGGNWPCQPDAALAAIERVTAERDAAMARIAKAWELHEPFTWSFGYGPVQSCKWCADHGAPQEVASWPCPTIQALEDVSNDQNLINPHNHAEVW